MTEYSGKQALLTMRIIHFAMMGGLVLFGLVILFLNTTGSLEVTGEGGSPLVMVSIAFCGVTVGISPMLFKQQLASKLKGGEDLRTKLAAYQTAHIIRCALLEGAGLFVTVVSMLTANNLLLIGLFVIVTLFAFSIPSAYLLERELNLSSKEKQQLI